MSKTKLDEIREALERAREGHGESHEYWPDIAYLLQRVDELEGSFKNFHRNLCKRFGYGHDDHDWQRDLASLEEHIAGKVEELEGENKRLKWNAESEWEQREHLLRRDIASLKLIADSLRAKLAELKVWGTDDCRNNNQGYMSEDCTGRITLFYTDDLCVGCRQALKGDEDE